jgi:hypothetical protein
MPSSGRPTVSGLDELGLKRQQLRALGFRATDSTNVESLASISCIRHPLVELTPSAAGELFDELPRPAYDVLEGYQSVAFSTRGRRRQLRQLQVASRLYGLDQVCSYSDVIGSQLRLVSRLA